MGIKKIISGALLVVLLVSMFGARSVAQSKSFSIQVSPSPIIETVSPGVTKNVELKIRNQSDQSEKLKIGLRSFSVNPENAEVTLNDAEPEDVKDWVSFKDPEFEVAAGQWFTQVITLRVPSDAGFSYSFAFYISRANTEVQQTATAQIEGSVAVFTLLTVDRPDAVKKIDLGELSIEKKVYEYLPTTFKVSLKNTGNTLVQPGGNIYIQRSLASTEPIAVLSVNEANSYMLPGVTRSYTSSWNEGFPVYVTNAETQKKKLEWDFGKIQNFRIGKYVAKVIVIYNDGQRDVPIEAFIEFWVIPWKLLLGVLLIVVLLITGVVTLLKKGILTAKKHKKEPHVKPSHEKTNE